MEKFAKKGSLAYCLNGATGSFCTSSSVSLANNVAPINREELEDKFFRLKEDHLVLKKEAHHAESRVKCLNAKLSRLISEKKKLVGSQKTKREVELEELIYDLKGNVDELERENSRLKEKSLLLKTQISSGILRNKISASYSAVRSRTDSGLTNFNYRITSANISSNRRSSSTLSLNRVTFAQQANQAHSRPLTAATFTRKAADPNKHRIYTSQLLREAQTEIKKLEEIIVMQQNLVETLLMRENGGKCPDGSADNSLAVSLKEYLMPNAAISPPESTKGEPPEEQEELNKGHSSTSLVAKHPSLRSGKLNKELTAYIESLRKELVEEKSTNSRLRKQLLSENKSDCSTGEMAQRLKELERENEILRDSLQDCIGSCLSDIEGKVAERQKKPHGGAVTARPAKEAKDEIKRLEEENERLKEELKKEREKVINISRQREELEQKLVLVEKNNNNPGLVCTRIDHLQLSDQVKSMEKEREELLSEFSEMKQLLGIIESNIQVEAGCEPNLPNFERS